MLKFKSKGGREGRRKREKQRRRRRKRRKEGRWKEGRKMGWREGGRKEGEGKKEGRKEKEGRWPQSGAFSSISRRTIVFWCWLAGRRVMMGTLTRRNMNKAVLTWKNVIFLWILLF
jgi:hypothetical protein